MSGHKKEASTSATRKESVESRGLVSGAFELARSIGIKRLLVRADLVSDINVVVKHRRDEGIVWITEQRQSLDESKGGVQKWGLETPPKDRVVVVPNLRLSRLSQVKLGLFVAVVKRYVEVEESIICLSGVAGSRRIDTLLITNPQRDFPWLRKEYLQRGTKRIASDVLESVIQIALQISVAGYEGEPLGTIFVLGNHEELKPHLRQLILNPCAGHPAAARSVFNHEFLDTLRELAAIDGAFVVNRQGTVESAGTYLDAPTTGLRLRGGLGARHTSAAAVTMATSAVAVVVSKTTGAVSVFHDGKLVLELEKPAPRAARKSRK
jgi:DNA integrity scanning protein DisA with diadenylate cyclase activity